MPIITLHTIIHAPVERCFLLSLSVDVHMSSTAKTREKAVAGVTSGIMKLNDTVTWEARHLGIRQRLTSEITVYEKPYEFVDEMRKGIFKKIHHRHLFREEGTGTHMTDIFEFRAPFGILGVWAEKWFLETYLTRFIEERNTYIKQVAESDEWRRFLPSETL